MEKKMMSALVSLVFFAGVGFPQNGESKPAVPTEIKSYTVHLVGYSHIDLAWLWRKEETIHLVLPRTFSSVLKLMEEFPGFKFTMSQGQLYEWARNFHPDIFNRIRQRAGQGLWEPISGWVENDCNLPGGESFVRQFLYGVKEIRRDFGKRTWIAICPDSFGYNGNMPQLLYHCGFRHFYTQKLHWNDTNEFPYRLFWWKGIDGTRILTLQSVGSYVEKIREKNIIRLIKEHRAHHPWIRNVMVVYGVGDHGGGPTRKDLENAVMLMKRKDFPKLKFSTVENYFRSVMGEGRDAVSRLPEMEGELYLEYHRGTYTSQELTKRFNLESETALVTAEKLCSIAFLYGESWPGREFSEAWKRHLLNQMHDILPGSGIKEVYDDAQKDYLANFVAARKVCRKAMRRLSALFPNVPGRRLVLFNSLSWERNALVELRLPEGVYNERGNFMLQGEGLKEPIPCQRSAMDRNTIVFRIKLPPMGFRTVGLVKGSSGGIPKKDVVPGIYTIENDLVKVTVDARTGRISSITDKRTGWEVLKNGGQAGYQFFDDKPKHYDAWNLGLRYICDIEKPESVEIVEAGPVRKTIKTVHRYSESKFVTYISVVEGDPKVYIRCIVDWLERRKLLKFAFPMSIDPDVATYEIAFGALQRSTRRRTSWEKARYEVSGLAFADLTEDGKGAAILTHGRHGFDAKDGVLRVSLLKAPVSPDPTADKHRHDLRIALLPHKGDWRDAALGCESREWNHPVLTFFVKARAGERMKLGSYVSFFSVEPKSVILETVKKAEERNSLILRLFESTGRPARGVVVHVPGIPARWRLVNGLEEPRDPDPYGEGNVQGIGKWHKGAARGIRLDFKPFQIRTIEVEM